mgnify:FL=1
MRWISGASRERRVVGITICVLALAWLSPVEAHASVRYEDTGFDANDVSSRIDIRATTRTVRLESPPRLR